MGSPVSRLRRFIQSNSLSRRASLPSARPACPTEPPGTSSNTAPERCMARPMANTSSSVAKVPGTGSPLID